MTRNRNAGAAVLVCMTMLGANAHASEADQVSVESGERSEEIRRLQLNTVNNVSEAVRTVSRNLKTGVR